MLTLGIDLSASHNKISPYALIDGDTNLHTISSFKSDEDLLQVLEEHQPDLVAIDVPLGMPLGLCCLEEECACVVSNGLKGRVGEVELASMGIGCFYTTKRSIIKGLIYRGMKLRRELVERGYQVIEVYPYATKVLLFGDQVPAKSNPKSLPFLKEKLSTLIQGLDPYVNELNHDRCDALLTAYTGYLHQMQLTDSLGADEEGFITMPQLPK